MFAVLWVALAAASDTVPRVELGRVYQEARAESPRIEAARALASAAQARVTTARRPPDPELQLGFMNYELPGLSPMDPTGMTQLQLMQMIPTAGKLGLSGRVAGAQAAAAGERARDVEWEVRAEAAMAFYDLYATDRALAVMRETLRLLHDIRGTAEAMYRVGEGRQADVLRAQVEIARMTEDTVRMIAMRTAMAGRLNATLNRSADAAVGSPVLPAFPDTLGAVEEYLALAQGRPMLRAAERELDAAASRATLARREIWPDLTIGLQYGRRPGEMGMGTEQMGSLMIGATLPVFGRQQRMRDEMGAMRQMAQADLTAMRASTRGDVSATHATLARARNLATLYRSTIIPQAEAAAASALAAYRVGNVDFMTLLDDRMTVNRYRQELFALDAEQGKAWSELEMLTGRELFDPNTPAPGARNQE